MGKKRSNGKTLTKKECQRSERISIHCCQVKKSIVLGTALSIVLLTGSVNTLENKNKVEDSVKKIDGVRQVNNQITNQQLKLTDQN